MAATRSATIAVELHVSDGQSFTDGALQLNEQPIGPTGAIFSGTTVPNGPSAAANSGARLYVRLSELHC